MRPYSRRPSDTTTDEPVTVFVVDAGVDGAGFAVVFVATVSPPQSGSSPSVKRSESVPERSTRPRTGAPRGESTGASLLAAGLPGVALLNAAAGGVFVGAVLKLSRTTSPATVATKTAMNLRMSSPS